MTDSDDTDSDDATPADLLEEVLAAFERLLDRDGVRVEADSDVSLGLGSASPAARPRSTRHPRRDRSRPRPAQRGRGNGRSPPEAEYHVDTERTDDRVELRADLLGVDPGDATVEAESGEVVLRVDGDVVERVPTGPGDWSVTDRTFNNGVLVVEARPAGGVGRE